MIKVKSTDYSTKPETIKVDTVMVGRSVYVRPETVQVMSDIWEDHMRVTSINAEGILTKHTVSGWYGMPRGGEHEYEIDATDEAFEDYRNQQFESDYKYLVAEAEKSAQDVAVKGRVVKVVSGRKAKGTVGKVVVVMDAYYGMGYHGYMTKKLGIATSPVMIEKVMANGKVFMNHRDIEWVWARNCEVEKVMPVDTAPLKEAAERFATEAVASLRKTATESNARYYTVKAA